MIRIVEAPASALAEYAAISIAFEVRTVLDVSTPAHGLGGLTLAERHLSTPYIKDYDAPPGDSPLSWARRFDLSTWTLLLARSGTEAVAGAAVAFDAPELQMLDGRRDLAILWDIRVAPDARGRGVGSALFAAVEAWSAARGARHLKVETQNVNVPACRFYARHGCVLGAINRFAYPELPDETQLLWYKELARTSTRA